MDGWLPAVAIFVGSLGLLAAILLVQRIALRQVGKVSAGRIASRYRPEQILRQDLVANFFGLESRGAAQLRGNGGLVLTADELWFTRAVAEEAFAIPLPEVLAVELVTSHLGKTVGRKLLKVRFRTPSGEDSIAWYVKDPEGWRAQLLRPGRKARLD